jgi:radical SAM superfamily enzyme YgiQ (UPF0313 family)
MKTLILHVPKFNNFYPPVGDFIWLTYMPAGLLAMADHLARHGHEVEVVHLGVEWVKDRSFRVDRLVEDRREVMAVGISLHWHHQAHDVLEVAGRIKGLRDDVFVFLGGDTASFFHEEIVRDYPVIDAVIRGHGEIPALELIRALDGENGLDGVPNLTWRDGHRIRQNGISYVGNSETISRLNYTNFSLLRHADTYVRYLGVPFFFAKGFTKEQNFRRFTLGAPVFPLPVGRGCPFNCAWCSGSQIPQHRYVSGLKGFVYRTHDSVIQSIQEARAAGYAIMHTAMDPEPNTQEYFIELFRRIRGEGMEIQWMFECNGLPSDAFVTEFQKTFRGPHAIIMMSPECGNETLRLKYKGPGFTTDAFFDKMDRMDGLGVSSEIFFTYGLPGENEELLEETVALQRKIRNRYRHVRALRTLSIEMEPGAPWHLEPEKFGIVTDRVHFRDFLDAHAQRDQGAFTSFGYYIPGYFTTPLDPHQPYEDFAARMQAIKCRKFCFIHPNPLKGSRPWQGRLFCGVVSRLIKMKPRDLTRPY